MSVIAATNDWSDAIAISATSMAQAQGGRIAIFIGSGTPAADETGTIIKGSDTVLIGVGSIRIKRAGGQPASLNLQAWLV